MDKKIKASWLKALRSGKYKQGKEALRKNNKFCCLGVLCDIYAKSHKSAKWVRGKDETYTFIARGIEEELVLPVKVLRWAKIPSLMGFGIVTKQGSLTNLNDNGKKFTTIAKIIETEL